MYTALGRLQRNWNTHRGLLRRQPMSVRTTGTQIVSKTSLGKISNWSSVPQTYHVLVNSVSFEDYWCAVSPWAILQSDYWMVVQPQQLSACVTENMFGRTSCNTILTRLVIHVSLNTGHLNHGRHHSCSIHSGQLNGLTVNLSLPVELVHHVHSCR